MAFGKGLNDDLYNGPKVTNYPSKGTNTILVIAWLVGGFLTVFIPLVFRTLKKNNYQNMYYMYNWEEAQQEYQQAQEEYMQQMEENYMAQYYDNGAYNYKYQWEQMRGNYDINQCKWYQLNCYPYYINEQGEPVPQAGWYPMWFSGWTKTEEEKQQMMEDGETSSALIFVYVWQILMFIVILAYGYKVIRENRIVSGVTIALVVFMNMAFLSMWMLADGSIVTDGQEVQRFGFYGQFSVLMFITNFWYILFGIVFTIVFVLRSRSMHKESDDATKNKQLHNAETAGGQQPVDAEANSNYKQLASDSPKSQRKPVWASTN